MNILSKKEEIGNWWESNFIPQEHDWGAEEIAKMRFRVKTQIGLWPHKSGMYFLIWSEFPSLQGRREFWSKI